MDGNRPSLNEEDEVCHKPTIPCEIKDQIRDELMSKVTPSPKSSPVKIFTIGGEDSPAKDGKGSDEDDKLAFSDLHPQAEQLILQDTKISSSTPLKSKDSTSILSRSRNNSVNTANLPNQTSSGSASPGINGPTKHSPEHYPHHTRRSMSSSSATNDITLIDYLYTEIRRGYDLGNDEQRYRERREKFYIFLRIPYQLEKFLSFGFLQVCYMSTLISISNY